MKILEGLLYTKEHEWVKLEDNIAIIGITDYAQHSMGDIVFVELPEEGTDFSIGDTFGVVESVKAASDVYSPLSGRVSASNQEIVDDPALLNQDPYSYWMIKLEITDSSELDGLMNASQYETLTSEE